MKPNPLMVTVFALNASAVALLVIAGATVAICTAVPLDCELVVTTAVRLPRDVGFVVKVTVSVVRVADETVPTAPLLNTTVLRPAIGSNPNPLTFIVEDVGDMLATLVVMTGLTIATCTAAPLTTALVVTIAVTLPAVFGLTVYVTVSEVDVAAVTVPVAPLLNTTLLRDAIASKPKPLIVTMLVEIPARKVLLVTTGTTVATWTAAMLVRVPVVTRAVRLVVEVGFVLSETVSEVAVAAVTVPTAPPLRVTALLAATGSNPNPLIVSVLALANRLAALLVTVGITVAT